MDPSGMTLGDLAQGAPNQLTDPQPNNPFLAELARPFSLSDLFSLLTSQLYTPARLAARLRGAPAVPPQPDISDVMSALADAVGLNGLDRRSAILQGMGMPDWFTQFDRLYGTALARAPSTLINSFVPSPPGSPPSTNATDPISQAANVATPAGGR